jgi:diguanylate cyclase (GGDEF)-like protein
MVASSLDPGIKISYMPGTPIEQSISGEPCVAIQEQLPGTETSQKLGFVILRQTKEIARPYDEARNAFLSVLVLSLVVSIFGGVAFGRGIVRPISTLADAARVIQSGQWPDLFEVQRGDEIGILQSSFNDMIRASKIAQERLLAMIDMDPLTELLNHRSFRERLSQEARRSEASQANMSLALVDLDHFGVFNDSSGRTEGDLVLKQVANIIRDCVPEFSVLGRYAGDQFALLLPNTDAESLDAIMNYVRIRLQQTRCPVTISVGCSEFPKNSAREDGLILAAELAKERAKQLGRNKVCLFDAVPGADKATDPFLLYQSLENGSFATIQALAAAVDAKDNYTNGHSERVAKYASMLSTAIGDPPDMVDRVFRCGTLHDVGKIGVPDAILKKPGMLEPDEIKVMETHPVLGELIAGKVPQLAELLPGVRSHHERWDGLGYPDKLSGETIPYIARVLAVADSYDAMTSDRPYRKGLSKEIALSEIEKSAGSQFDPRMADAFVLLFRETPATF